MQETETRAEATYSHRAIHSALVFDLLSSPHLEGCLSPLNSPITPNNLPLTYFACSYAPSMICLPKSTTPFQSSSKYLTICIFITPRCSVFVVPRMSITFSTTPLCALPSFLSTSLVRRQVPKPHVSTGGCLRWH